MAAKGKKSANAKKNATKKKNPKIAEEEEALAQLEAEATKLREEIATEEAKKEELLNELKNLHEEWLFDRSRLTELQESRNNLHISLAEERSLHATQSRIEKQKLLKIYLKVAAAAAARLLQTQAALVLREKQHTALLADAEALTASFREEALTLHAARLLLLGALRMQHDQRLQQIRKEAERRDGDILLKHKATSNELRETREKALRKMIANLEEQKNKQILDQQMENKKLLQNTKRFFTDVTSASLSLIRQLKKEQEELKHVESRSMKTLEELHATNRSLAEPLSILRQETEQMQQILQVYALDLQQIAAAKDACKKQEKLLFNINLQQEIIKQQIIQLNKQKYSLSSLLQENILNIQQIKAVENTVLQKKAKVLQRAEEIANTQANELNWVGSKENKNSSFLSFSSYLQYLLNNKTKKEELLKYKIQQVKELYRNTLDKFLGAIHGCGLSTQDLAIQLKNI